MTQAHAKPFGGAVPATVHLTRTPLASVLAQIRFTPVAKLADQEFVAEFQERIRKAYPFFSQDNGVMITVKADGVERAEHRTWRFMDSEKSWRVSLTPDFVALETRNYRDRDDFCARLLTLCEALKETVDPGLMMRIGIRYVDRMYGDDFEKFDQYVKPEMSGPFAPHHQQSIIRTGHQVNADTDEGSIAARWGVLPAGETHDPESAPPLDVDSWYLDIDSFSEKSAPVEFEPKVIYEEALSLAARSYAFFRWAITNEFLQACGGKVE